MAKWLLDAGHGGTDPGATYNGRNEADDVLKLTKRVGEILKANGETVDFTRTTNTFVSLEARTNMENRNKYDYFVSFHRNDATDKAGNRIGGGVETYSLATTGQGRKLAENVQGELKNLFTDRGCKTKGFWVLSKTNCSAILVELGFIHNSQDNAIWDNRYEELTTTIAKGCLKQVGKNISNIQTKPPVAVSTNHVYRIFHNGQQQGTAYANIDYILSEVKKGLEKGLNKIELIKK